MDALRRCSSGVPGGGIMDEAREKDGDFARSRSSGRGLRALSREEPPRGLGT